MEAEPSESLDLPVLLIAFNRPEATARVWERIRDERPLRLYVAVDGPRGGGHDDEGCARVRELVSTVDWPCDLRTRISDVNQGPGWGPRNAIDWLFANEEAGVIIEDDTLPQPGMMRFVRTMLHTYADDDRVMTVAGTSLAAPHHRGSASWVFSRYATTWGWGTWRRAWQKYDWAMADWPDRRSSSWLRDIGGTQDFARYWTNVFDQAYADPDHYWDYQWQYACWSVGGLAVHPTANLVTNIGMSGDGTHAFQEGGPFASMSVGSLPESLVAPVGMEPDRVADRWIDLNIYRTRQSLRGRAYRAVRSFVGR